MWITADTCRLHKIGNLQFFICFNVFRTRRPCLLSRRLHNRYLGPYERFKQIHAKSIFYAVEDSMSIHEYAFDVPQELVLYHTRRLRSPLTTQMPHCVCQTKHSICVQLDNANAVLWTTKLPIVVNVTAPMNQV